MITLKAGMKVPEGIGPYTGANIRSVSANGWCKCEWDDGRKFNARAHWICQRSSYKIDTSK